MSNEQFCQQPSQRYLKILDHCGGDPRSAAGLEAIAQLAAGHGGINAMDAREASGTANITADNLPEIMQLLKMAAALGEKT